MYIQAGGPPPVSRETSWPQPRGTYQPGPMVTMPLAGPPSMPVQANPFHQSYAPRQGPLGVAAPSSALGVAAPSSATYGHAPRGLAPPSTEPRIAGSRGELAAQQGQDVTLHVYDVTGRKRVRFANKVLKVFGTGAYHAAVEVGPLEWSYGSKHRGTGVFACPPASCEAHHYRKSYPMGKTSMTEEQVKDVIHEMAIEWQGRDYDLLRHNCTHFSNAFCQRLGVGPLPAWVMSLAATGAQLDDLKDKGKRARGADPDRDHYRFGDIFRGVMASWREGDGDGSRSCRHVPCC